MYTPIYLHLYTMYTFEIVAIGCQYIYVAIVCTNTLGKLVLKIVPDGEYYMNIYRFIYFCVYSMLRFLPASCYLWLPFLDSPSRLVLHLGLVNLL